MGEIPRIPKIPLTHFWPNATETRFDKLVLIWLPSSCRPCQVWRLLFCISINFAEVCKSHFCPYSYEGVFALTHKMLDVCTECTFHHMFFQSGSFLSRCIYSKTLPLLYFLVCSRRITDYNKYIYFTYKWLIIKFSILSSDRRIYSTHFFNHTEFHFRHSLCLQASAVQSLWKVTLAINSPLHVKHMSCLHMWYTLCFDMNWVKSE